MKQIVSHANTFYTTTELNTQTAIFFAHFKTPRIKTCDVDKQAIKRC